MNKKNSTPSELKSELLKLKRELKRNQKLALEQEKTIAELRHNFEERIKELHSKYEISRILSETQGSTEDTLLQVIEKLPDAFQFPGMASVYLKLMGKEYRTPDFRKSSIVLTSKIKLQKKEIGALKVYYNPGKEAKNKPGFLSEEQDLLNAVALRLSDFAEKLINNERLRQEEKQFRDLYEEIAQGIVYQNTTGEIISANPAAERILGLSLDQMQGRKSIDPHWRPLREDGTDFPGEEHPAMESLRTGKPVEGTVMGVYNPKKNDYSWMIINAEPEFRAGEEKPYRVFTSFTDITELKKRDAELKKHYDMQKLLLKITNSFIDMPLENADQAISEALREIGEFIGADRVYIFEYDYKNRWTNNINEWCARGIEPQIDSLQQVSFDIAPEWLEIHSRGESIIYQDVSALPEDTLIRRILMSQQVKSMVTVPVLSGNTPTGFVGIDFVRHLHTITPYEVTLIFVFSQMLHNLQNRFNSQRTLKATNERMAKIMNSIEAFVYIADMETYELLFVNDYGKSVWGPEMEGKVCYQVLQGKDSPCDFCTNKLLVNNEGQPAGVYQWEFQNLVNNRWYDIRDNAIPWTDGRLVRMEIATDITEKKLAAIKIQQSEQNYRNLFFNSPDGYLIIKDAKFLECNKASEKMIGGERNDLIGKTPWDISPSHQPNGRESQEYANELIEQVFASGSAEFEWLHKRCDGTEFLARVNLSVMEYNGEQTLFTTWQDITDKKRAEDEIRKFKLIADKAAHGNAIADLNGRLIYCNKAFANMHGYEPAEVIGKNLSIFHSAEQMPVVQKTIEILFTAGEFPATEIGHIRKDGTTFPSLMSGSMISDDQNRPLYISSTLIDITELKAAEDELMKFRTISDKANISFAIADPQGIFTYVNDHFSESHGYVPGELIGQPISVIVADEDLDLVPLTVGMLIESQEFKEFPMTHKRKDGTTFPTLMNGMLVRDEEGVPLYMWSTTFDITKIKNYEKSLLVSEEKLNFAQEIAGMGSWEYDLKTDEMKCSKNYLKLIGIDRKGNKISLSEIKDRTHPADKALIERDYGILFREKKKVNLTSRIVMPDGSVRWMETDMVPLFEGNEITAISGVSIDVTEKKAAEQEIKKLTLAIEQSPVAIIVTDLEGRIQYTSKSFEKITGYTQGEVLGEKTSILKSGKTEDRIYKDMWETITTGKTWNGEILNKKKNGELFWENIFITPIQDEYGAYSNYLAVKEDISQRKKAEEYIRELNLNLEKRIDERTKELAEANTELLAEIENRKKAELALTESSRMLQQFFDVALDLLCIADLSGNFIKVNKAWEDILGYPAGELEKRTFIEFVHPDDLEATYQAMSQLGSDTPVVNFINRYRTRSGEYRFIEWRSMPSSDMIYAAARDITKRIITENDLAEARNFAEKANREKSEFLSRMSHELRTPMNSILGFAQLLEMGDISDSHKKAIRNILKSGKHLLGLINEVLDISRIEAGKISVSLEPINLDALIAELSDAVMPLAVKNNITWQPYVNTGLFVMADKQRLKQVMLNLLNNAIKYNRKEGTMSVKAEVSKEASGSAPSVRITVSDNGVGISESDIGKLFRPFERIGAEKTEIEGTGLGLVVVKKLIDVMGGRIGVRSEYEKGSDFWFELEQCIPTMRDIKSELDADNSIKVKTELHSTILLIEDNSSNIELVEQILETARPGINLVFSKFGSDAVPLAKEHHPSLILLDLNLPDIHGSDVLRYLLSDNATKDIPVVIVSADAISRQSGELLKAGAKDYIIKPIQIDVFLETIDKFLQIKS
ncbi:MAG: PAS domain S-box protein [Ignavibacteriaceae bacterium]|nr:PAS domain S-box protein [Ignavibacteriaceae bacterium]